MDEKVISKKAHAASRLIKARLLEALSLAESHDELSLLAYLTESALIEANDVEERLIIEKNQH